MADLETIEHKLLESFLEMGEGYVLNFSNKTFAEFFKKDMNIDISQEKYKYNGDSKAKLMRAFWKIEDNKTVGSLIKKLIYYKKCSFILAEKEMTPSDNSKIEECEKIAHRLLKGIKKDDMDFVGKGGFAEVFLQKSTGLIVKQLKEEYWSDQNIIHRFKREYEITRSLSDYDNIIKVYDFDEESHSYTMEKADETFEKYIKREALEEDFKKSLIIQILKIFKWIHNKDVIHRDISPNNMLVLSGKLKVSDFGLGKQLDQDASHKTCDTRSLGQFFYCAPEQLEKLSKSTKQSDVFSLGRLINFILTSNPNNYEHIFKNITKKATSNNIEDRYADAGVLLQDVEKRVRCFEKKIKEEQILHKMSTDILDEDVCFFIEKLNAHERCKMLIDKVKGFENSIIFYMLYSEELALDTIKGINDTYQIACLSFVDYDPIAYFANSVLEHAHFQYNIKKIAADILVYIAGYINRYNAQGLIESLFQRDIDPMLKEALSARQT